MRARPKRLDRLPQQYFVALLGRVAAAAAAGGPPLVDLGRGNPEVGPPPHVVEALSTGAARANVHGYAPIRGLARTKEALAGRYRDVYGVELDPEREIALIPGTKTAIVELALSLADEGDRILLPDPYYPDYPSGPAFAGAQLETVTLRSGDGWSPDLDGAPAAAALYLNYPSNPCAVCVSPGTFEGAVRWAERTGGAIVHDAAYIDIVFDGRRPQSFLSTPGAKDVGVEMWSMSKTYGMAGWRIGFVVGNAEIVERINLLNDHSRVGIFEPLQHAAVAALEGPQDSVAARVADYERRRDRIAAAVPGSPVCEGTFFVWLRLPDGLTAETLLLEHRIAVAPGEGFGPSGTGWARLSLAVEDETLELGAERLEHAFAVAGAGR
ncbi:MAG TPA: aminotransferase class I/II-fold pyridoxal phosphate-dependent enzyme [Gaiellaceae bacterium]|nr:aminotransferase class I/II-fold pyridoxal phosphate-dependent enzyme [Gaiellaceae bacterium]